MKPQLARIASIGCMALVMITATANAKGIELDVIAQDGAFYKAVAEAYAESGVKHKAVLQVQADSYDEVAQRAARGALIGDEPDVVFMGYNQMAFTVDRGIAKPIDGLLGDADDLAAMGYPAAALDLCRVDGVLYGLPFATSLPVVFYNAGLVKKAGGDPAAFPSTWEGIIELANRIDKLDKRTMGLFFRYVHSGNWSWQALITSHGGSLMSEDGKTIAFNSQAGEAALDILSKLKNAGMIDMSTRQARQAFNSGTLGLLFDSSSLYARAQSNSDFDVKIAPYPAPVENSLLPGGGNCAVLTTSDPERETAAIDFMRFATGPVGQTVLIKATGYISTNTVANSDPAYLGNYFKENPALQTVKDTLPRLTAWKAFPGQNAPRIVEVVRGLLQTVINHEATPDEAMERMVSEVGALLAE